MPFPEETPPVRRFPYHWVGYPLLLTLCFYLGWTRRYTLEVIEECPIVYGMEKDAPPSIASYLKKCEAMSYPQLIKELYVEGAEEVIDEGYTKRDIALSVLVTHHQFALEVALKMGGESSPVEAIDVTLEGHHFTLLSGLGKPHYHKVKQFIGERRFPFTPEGLFLRLQGNKGRGRDLSLMREQLAATDQFRQLFSLFSRHADRNILFPLLLEGDWSLFCEAWQKVEEAHERGKSSLMRRFYFLEPYLRQFLSQTRPSLTKALNPCLLSLTEEKEELMRSLADGELSLLIRGLPMVSQREEALCRSICLGIRGKRVQEVAAKRLYAFFGKPIPSLYVHEEALQELFPELYPSPYPRADVAASPAVIAKEDDLAAHSKALPKSSKKLPKLQPPEATPPEAKPPEVKDTRSPSKGSLSKSSDPLPVRKERYVVEKGDSLWRIAKKHNVALEALIDVNDIPSPNHLEVGSLLFIPASQ